jgi:uncharacterized membrane protein
MSFRRTDGLSVGVIGLSAAVTALVYDRLPERMATHFDLAGNPNGWMPRAWGAWFMPIFALVLWVIVRYARSILPQSEKRRLDEGKAALVASLLAVFLAAMHVLILWVAIEPGASLMKAVWLLAGALYAALGLILPRVKRNALVGVRTPWTLTSDENWARTQRVASWAMCTTGVAAAIFGVAGGVVGGAVALGFLLLGGLVPAVYSLVLARRLDRGA